jgi:surface polysaccharide O-acyltransferase-like enzyme
VNTAEGVAPDVRARYAEVDWIKAVGIVTVVVIHCLRPPWSPHASGVERLLADQLRFAVPGFLLCTGFLQARAGAERWSSIGSSLRRLLVPYLVASIGAFVHDTLQSAPPKLEGIVQDLLTGSAFDHYYYVFVAVTLVLITPLVARCSQRTLVLWAALLLLLQALWFASTGSGWEPFLKPESHFWRLRSPILWWSYFFVGWLVRLHEARIRDVGVRWRVPIASGLAVVLGATVAGRFLPIGAAAFHLLVWIQIFACLAWIGVLAIGRSRVPSVVRRLSEATYAIYLFHLLFLLPLQAWWPQPAGRLDPAVLLGQISLTMVGMLALVAAGRRLLGARSRLLLGA